MQDLPYTEDPAEGRRPSAKQIETLDTIWERATKRG